MRLRSTFFLFFFFNDTATTEIYTLSLHDALPISGFGVPVRREARVATIAEAISAARELSYPVVLKALSDDIAHKTELGLVAVGLKNGEQLAHAFARLSERLDRLDPPPSERAFLVQEFVADGP